MQYHSSDQQFNTHLLTMLSVASGMAGVCATAIGLIGIVKSLNKIETIVDDLFAVGALLFLAVTGLAFIGLRTRLGRTWLGLITVLDVTFFLGLGAVVVASLLLTWMVI
jgi:hypothetical protein